MAFANPLEELRAHQDKLINLIDGAKAANRDLTDAEVADVEAINARARELKAAIERGEKSAALMAGGGNLEESVHGTNRVLNDGSASNVKGFLTQDGIKAVAQAALRPEAKALTAGAVTPVALDPRPRPLAIPLANRGILDVVPIVKRETPTYSYVKQTLRTNNAAVVAAGAQKPTSPFTVAPVENSLEVYAHLSEYVDSYLMEDNSFLEGFLVSELTNGIFAKVTADAAAALGTESGIQTQVFSNTVADSLYLAASKSQELGYDPNAVLLTRSVLDGLILAKDTTEQYLGAPLSIVNGELLIWGFLRPVIATGLPTDSAVVFDSSKVTISTDTAGIKTKVDAITKIDYNQARYLVEGRFAFDIEAPASIVKVATVASGA